MTQLPIPVHVGSQSPEHWDDIEARQRQHGDDAAPYLRDKRRPSIAKPDIDWGAHRAQPDGAGSGGAEEPRPLALPTPAGLNCGPMTPLTVRLGDGWVKPFAFGEYLLKASELVLVVGRSTICCEYRRVPQAVAVRSRCE